MPNALEASVGAARAARPVDPKEAAQTSSTQLDVQRKEATVGTEGPQAAANLRQTQQTTTNAGSKLVDDMRAQFNKDPAYVKYNTTMTSLASALRTGHDITGDLALTYYAAKLFDPDSAVREAEQAALGNTVNLTAKVEQRIRKEFGLVEGGTFTPEARNKLRQEVIKRAQVLDTDYNRARRQYSKLAVKRGFDAEDVVGEHLGSPYREELASYDARRRASQTKSPATEGSVGLFDTPPEGTEIAGQDIKGWRVSQPAEREVATYLRADPHPTGEGYAQMLADKAVAEGKLKKEDVPAFVASNSEKGQAYIDQYTADPKTREAIPMALSYEGIDKEAQDKAGFTERLGQSLENIPESAVQMGQGLIALPADALASARAGELQGSTKGIVDLGSDLVGAGDGKTKEAFLKMMGERYGGWDALKRTATTDPLGLAGDVSMIGTLGGTAGARLPGVVGSVARKVAQTASVLDPVTAAGSALLKTPRLVGDIPDALGDLGRRYLPAKVADAAGTVAAIPGKAARGVAAVLPRVVPGEGLRRAGAAGYKAGKEGANKVSERFWNHLTGKGSPNEIVESAERALKDWQDAASKQYERDLVATGQDKTILSFDEIDKTLADLKTRAYFGDEIRDFSAARVYDEALKEVEYWKTRKPDEYHTPMGFDTLKQRLGNIANAERKAGDYNAAAIADGVYKETRNTIANQVPSYKTGMVNYEEAADALKEVRDTFSVNFTASSDTKSRKLLSIARENVNTNFGERARLGDMLEKYRPGEILDPIYAQDLKAWVPRGTTSLWGQGVGGAVLGGGGTALSGGSGLIPAALAGVATGVASSPRIVGTAAYGIGNAAGKTSRAADALAGLPDILGDKLTQLSANYPKTATALRHAPLASSMAGSRLEEGGLYERDAQPHMEAPPVAAEAPSPRIDEETGEVVLPDGTRVPLSSLTAKPPGFAYGGAVRRLSHRYNCGGRVRRA